MKTFTLSILLLISFSALKAQMPHDVPYYNWSNPNIYQISPRPIIRGNTYTSDSIAEVLDFQEVYEHNGEFYPINSWADYYFWYTTKYSFNFDSPDLYEYYYYTKNDYNMVKYLVSNFTGSYYPARISVSIEGEPEISSRYNKKILDNNPKQELKFAKRLSKEEKRYRNVTHTSVRMEDYGGNTSVSSRRQTSSNSNEGITKSAIKELPSQRDNTLRRSTSSTNSIRTNNYQPSTKSVTSGSEPRRSTKTLPSKNK